MNARSKFVPLMTGWLFKTPAEMQLVDRRGAVRTVKHFTGVNKGREYPYASKRQKARVYRGN